MASSVSFSSVGSGIDFSAIRDAILTQRARPISQMQTKANIYNNRIESLKQFNAALAALTTASEALTSRELGTGRSALTGDANVVTASATTAAALGAIDLNVTRLATSLTQTSRAFTATNAPILANGATSATFQLVKGGSGVQLPPPPVELAQGKTATASSVLLTNNASRAVDGNTSTAWQSQLRSNNEWIMVDLGQTANISRIELQWGTDYATGYKMQVSNDGVTWTDVNTTTSGNGGIDDITGLSASGRYVRMQGTSRSNQGSGYTLNEFKVYGTTGPAFTPTNKTITIDSTNNTLEGLKNAINAAGAGVTASIVDVTGNGTQQKLVLSSTETGASGRVELIETTATGTGANLNLSSINPPDGDFSKLDASFSVNGLTLTRSKNEISDAVAGVTFTLKKSGAAAVTVAQSSDMENKLRGFINAYNAVQDFIGKQYTKDSKDRPTGILAGDPTLRNVQQQLRAVVGSVSENNGGALNSLAQIGITVGTDNQLAIDSTVFNDRLKADSESVRALLFGKTANERGLFNSIHTDSKGISDSVTGSVQAAINGYGTSVKSLNETIAKRTESLNRLRDSLTKQFSIADAAIGQLNGQGAALTNIIKSLEPKTN